MPILGEPAPPFTARTTMGERSLTSYRGRWLVFFSHPADFTPVCTSEFIAMARAHDRFQALGCDLLALSVDSLFSHLAWVSSIRDRFGVTIPFPIVEDPSMVIARAYGMLPAGAASSATVRANFVIDPTGIIRALNWYPMTTGRSAEEILRLVAALRFTDAEHVLTPADWQPGEAAIAPTPVTIKDAEQQLEGRGVIDWYYRLVEREHD
jgi:peroxiredoxin (alkyl hydroperoxide reductase subunit C)